MNHGALLRKQSNDDQELVVEIGRDYASSRLEEQDKVMLAFAEKLTFNHTEMDRDDIESLKAVGFSDENILDIIASVAYRNFSNRLNIAIGLDEDVTEGDQDLLNIAKSGHSMSMV